jgi:hypothetical protein
MGPATLLSDGRFVSIGEGAAVLEIAWRSSESKRQRRCRQLT